RAAGAARDPLWGDRGPTAEVRDADARGKRSETGSVVAAVSDEAEAHARGRRFVAEPSAQQGQATGCLVVGVEGEVKVHARQRGSGPEIASSLAGARYERTRNTLVFSDVVRDVADPSACVVRPHQFREFTLDKVGDPLERASGLLAAGA